MSHIATHSGPWARSYGFHKSKTLLEENFKNFQPDPCWDPFSRTYKLSWKNLRSESASMPIVEQGDCGIYRNGNLFDS